jgi:hypothetical protein
MVTMVVVTTTTAGITVCVMTRLQTVELRRCDLIPSRDKGFFLLH